MVEEAWFIDLRNRSEEGDHKGHSIERHVGKDKEWLVDRIDNTIKQYKDMGQKIPEEIKVSSYPDLKTADDVTKEVIERNMEKISEWYDNANPYSKEGFKADLGKIIGHGLRQGENMLQSKTRAQVVLKKMADGTIKIFSSYPID